METSIHTKTNTKATFRAKINKFKPIAIIVAAVAIFTSCETHYWGYDGNPGRAYLALSWYDYEPNYLDVGNSEIPYTFYWDEFYRVTPGYYSLYYEMSYTSWGFTRTRAYEMEYEIWEEAGEPGGLDYNGCDGRDTYFTIDLTKKGPFLYEEIAFKSNKTDMAEVETNQLGEINTLIKRKDGFGIKIIWKEVEPRQQ